MTADQAFVVEMWSIVNGAAIVVLVILSFASGWLILEGLDVLERRISGRERFVPEESSDARAEK